MKRPSLMGRFIAGMMLALVALVSAIFVMPARWLIAVLPDAWPVSIVDASGSIWQGSALLALGPYGARTTLPDPISWRYGWTNGPRVELTHPWLDCRLALRPRMGSVGLSPCAIRLPAAVLATLGAPLNTLKPSGELEIRWPGLQLGRSLPSGELALLDWRNAGSALSYVRPLGHYQVRLAGMNNRVELELSTTGGPLFMQGSGNLRSDGAFQFSGVARPSSGASPQTAAGLQTILSAIGRRSGDDTLLQIGSQRPG